MDEIVGCPNREEGEGCKYSVGLQREMENFQSMTRHLAPSQNRMPSLENIDMSVEYMPFNGVVGGDLIVPVEFKRDFDLQARIKTARRHGRRKAEANLKGLVNQAGILIADGSGHDTTDAVQGSNLYYAFKTGISYELVESGKVTPRLFEVINHVFHNPDQEGPYKFLTMLYGEILEDGTFKFISAGHPSPLYYSRESGGLVELARERSIASIPLGWLSSMAHIDNRWHWGGSKAKGRYKVNTMTLNSPGDMLLLYTDGLSEHYKKDAEGAGVEYFPSGVERVLRETRDLSASEISSALKRDLLDFAAPQDDISYVVIKRRA
jgi:serine phosphatase RsbU (regulator of sigma subunit)